MSTPTTGSPLERNIIDNIESLKQIVDAFAKIPDTTKGDFVREFDDKGKELHQFVPSGGWLYSWTRYFFPSPEKYNWKFLQWAANYTTEYIPWGVQKVARLLTRTTCAELEKELLELTQKVHDLFKSNATLLGEIYKQGQDVDASFERIRASLLDLSPQPIVDAIGRLALTYSRHSDNYKTLVKYHTAAATRDFDFNNTLFNRMVQIYFDRKRLAQSSVLPNGVLRVPMPSGEVSARLITKKNVVPSNLKLLSECFLNHLRQETSQPLDPSQDPLEHAMSVLMKEHQVVNGESYKLEESSSSDKMKAFADVILNVKSSKQNAVEVRVNRILLQGSPVLKEKLKATAADNTYTIDVEKLSLKSYASIQKYFNYLYTGTYEEVNPTCVGYYWEYYHDLFLLMQFFGTTECLSEIALKLKDRLREFDLDFVFLVVPHLPPVAALQSVEEFFLKEFDQIVESPSKVEHFKHLLDLAFRMGFARVQERCLSWLLVQDHLTQIFGMLGKDVRLSSLTRTTDVVETTKALVSDQKRARTELFTAISYCSDRAQLIRYVIDPTDLVLHTDEKALYLFFSKNEQGAIQYVKHQKRYGETFVQLAKKEFEEPTYAPPSPTMRVLEKTERACDHPKESQLILMKLSDCLDNESTSDCLITYSCQRPGLVGILDRMTASTSQIHVNMSIIEKFAPGLSHLLLRIKGTKNRQGLVERTLELQEISDAQNFRKFLEMLHQLKVRKDTLIRTVSVPDEFKWNYASFIEVLTLALTYRANEVIDLCQSQAPEFPLLLSLPELLKGVQLSYRKETTNLSIKYRKKFEEQIISEKEFDEDVAKMLDKTLLMIGQDNIPGWPVGDRRWLGWVPFIKSLLQRNPWLKKKLTQEALKEFIS